MTTRLDKAVARIKALPADQQDRVAEFLLELAEENETRQTLTPAQIAGVHAALEQAERREFASEESVEGLLLRNRK